MKNEKNNREKVRKFLEKHAVAVLSTISPDNTPHAAAIYAVPDDSCNCYFLTNSDSKKSQNLMANGNAALTIVDPAIPMILQATGKVTKVDEPHKFLHMFIKIAQENAKQHGDFHWLPPLAKMKSHGALRMYKFEPNWLRMGDFSDAKNSAEAKKDIFQQLIPSN